MARPADPVKRMSLWAIVGEGEAEGAGYGIKQVACPDGRIPLVSVEADKLDQGDILRQIQDQVNKSGKSVRLVRFKFAEAIMEIKPCDASSTTPSTP